MQNSKCTNTSNSLFPYFENDEHQPNKKLDIFRLKSCLIKITAIHSVLMSVSCPKVLFHLESDNLFHNTVVVADWLG